MNTNRKIARTVGILFIIGTIAGMLSYAFILPVLNAPDYLVKLAESKWRVFGGVLLVLTMGISLSSMTVVLYPVLKKYNETLAMGALVFRGVLELASYFGTMISWSLLLTLSKEYVSAGTPAVSSFPLIGTMLFDLSDQIGNMAGTIVFSIGALFVYYIFYKTKLIPTWLSLWGILGAILYLSTGILFIVGFNFMFLQAVLGVQEMVMAVWLIVKGFNSSAFNSLMAKQQIK